jgi:hypothetical protein
LRQVVVALEEFAPRKRPPPADPYLWLCTGTRESAGLKPSGRNLPAGGRGAGAASLPSARCKGVPASGLFATVK